MAQSQNTANLKALLDSIDAKITALKNAKTALDNVDIKVKNTMDGIEGLHVAGQKYDEEYEDEQNGIDTCIKKFSDKRKTANEIISEQLGALAIQKLVVNIEYMASVAADKALEQLAKK